MRDFSNLHPMRDPLEGLLLRRGISAECVGDLLRIFEKKISTRAVMSIVEQDDVEDRSPGSEVETSLEKPAAGNPDAIPKL